MFRSVAICNRIRTLPQNSLVKSHLSEVLYSELRGMIRRGLKYVVFDPSENDVAV